MWIRSRVIDEFEFDFCEVNEFKFTLLKVSEFEFSFLKSLNLNLKIKNKMDGSNLDYNYYACNAFVRAFQAL